MNRGRQNPSAPDSDEALSRALDRAAELERSIIAEARSAPPSAAELQAVEAATRPRPALRLRTALVAAGLLVVAFLAWRSFAGGKPRALPRGVTLGAKELRILAPEGPVDAFTVIRWSTAERGAARFEVRVIDEATDTLLVHETDLRESELTLEGRDTSTWRRIRVEVDLLDSAGEPVGSGRALAWRSP